MALDPQTITAPEFPAVDWLNTDHPPALGGLRGRTVAIEFWDFTCINCLRTLPYLRDWHERYRPAGLQILGIHTPEFRFARSERHVRAALGRLGIGWPVALDNDQAVWTAYANRAWPSLHLVDRNGAIRARHIGEGGYPRAEADLRALLSLDAGDASRLPEPAGVLRSADVPGAVCLPSTNELQVDSLGNGPASEKSATALSLPASRHDGRFYLDGDWRLKDDGLTLVSDQGSVVVPFHAATVHAVLAPHTDPDFDPVEPVRIEALLDERPIPGEFLGQDLTLRSSVSAFTVDRPRTYHLLAGLDPAPHELRLQISRPGLTLYAFSFGACLAAPDPRSTPC